MGKPWIQQHSPDSGLHQSSSSDEYAARPRAAAGAGDVEAATDDGALLILSETAFATAAAGACTDFSEAGWLAGVGAGLGGDGFLSSDASVATTAAVEEELFRDLRPAMASFSRTRLRFRALKAQVSLSD